MEQRAERPLLVAKVRDVRMIATLLRSLAQTVICQVVVSGPGLQVTTDQHLSLQSNAFIGEQLFDKYEFNPPREDIPDPSDGDEDDVPTSTFEVSLSTWLACLNIYGTGGPNVPSTNGSVGPDRGGPRVPFGSVGTGEGSKAGAFGRTSGQTSVEISYAAHGEPLVLKLEEGNVTTRCELATSRDTLPANDMPYINEQTESQVIMRSKDLTEALLSIDQSCKHVAFSFSEAKRPRRRRRSSQQDEMPHTPRRGHTSTLDMAVDSDAKDRAPSVAMMRITASGDAGSTELEFPNRNRVFESFACSIEGSYSYDYKTLQQCLRALQASSKCSIRVDQNGMMSLQCMFPARPVPVPPTYNDDDRRGMTDQSEAALASAERHGTQRHGFVETRLLAKTDEALGIIA